MIEIKHLRTLQELYNTGSLVGASIKIHQTPSAISHQLSTLEKHLGFKIFFRKSKPLRFTIQGEILLQLAAQVLPKIKIFLQKAYDNEHPNMKFRISMECHSCIQLLNPAMENFKKNFPKVIIDFHSIFRFHPQYALQKGALDLVLTSDILSNSGLQYLPIFSFEVRLVLHPDHPLVRKKNIMPEDLSNEILMIYPIHKKKIDIWRYFLKPAGIIPIWKNVENTFLLINMVSARIGITALPHWVVDIFERKGLVVTKTISNGLWSCLYAAVRYEKNPLYHNVTEAFIYSLSYYACRYIPFVRLR